MAIISIVGKGGTGKTTLSALLVNYLIEQNISPILAVDADPNFNLNEMLGVKIEATLSEIRESILKGEVPNFMSGYDYVEMKVNEILIEDKNFDLLVMGYPESSGCYCPVHAFLSQALERLLNNYPYTIIDNEAGMEHISRLNILQMEHLIIVTDANPRGILTAKRISDLVKALKIKVEKMWLVVNKTPQNFNEEVKKYAMQVAEECGLSVLGFLPEDPEVLEYELNKIPVFEWNSSLKKEAFAIFHKLQE